MIHDHTNMNAKTIASKYVNSCVTREHLTTMYNYLELYLKKFGDHINYHVMVNTLDNKLKDLIDNGN